MEGGGLRWGRLFRREAQPSTVRTPAGTEDLGIVVVVSKYGQANGYLWHDGPPLAPPYEGGERWGGESCALMIKYGESRGFWGVGSLIMHFSGVLLRPLKTPPPPLTK